MTTRNKYDGETPDMSDLMKMAAEGVLENFYAALPARIVSYDAAKACADVKPVVKTQDADGNIIDMPVIPCCQVLFPAGGGFSIAWPLQAGDLCLVVFSSKAMAQWAIGGDEEAQPESARRGALSDGIVIPGMRPQSNALAGAQGDTLSIGLDDGSSTITIDGAGLVTVAQTLQVGGGAKRVADADAVYAELLAIQASLASVPAPTPYIPAGSPSPPGPGADTITVSSITGD